MIQVIKRSLNILRYISLNPDTPRGLGEIADAVGLNASTCARVLATLVSERYVEQIAPRKGYVLGPLAYSLGAHGVYRRDLVFAAEPILEAMTRDIDETLLISVLRGNHRIIVMQTDGSRDIQVRGSFSSAGDPYATATGRLLLAYLGEREVQAFIAGRGLPDTAIWPEAQNAEALQAALEQIRIEGRAIRRTKETIGFAFPVIASGKIRCSLGCFLPVFRFEGEHKNEILAALERQSVAIAQNIEKGERYECK